ncbi:hypothetical protein HQ585_18645, partial [candidate division KSB1 bacterium]|nr:hypothetical protein [candidate division KSB1 bacterium]
MKRVLCLFMLFALCHCLWAQADFGDAPDGTTWFGQATDFPTLDARLGPKHTSGDASTYWIGRLGAGPPNTTTMEADANILDMDWDDGQPWLFILVLGIPPASWVTVPITTSPSHNPTQPIYLNVAIDVDNDLDWTDSRDRNWVVRNKVVYVPADTTLGFVSGPFGFGSDLLLLPVWLRATVTDVPVASPWGGLGIQGGWTFGETEDWLYMPG